ncbi:MAG: amidohydrolase family protein [Rhizomicrobium sp.]
MRGRYPGTRMPNAAFAFRHATVLPMDRDVALEDRTVVVRDGRIAALGPSDAIEIPHDALVVDARGKYLIPGLCDMHVHISPSGPGPALNEIEAMRRARQFLLVFLSSGITTVRNMAGTPMHLALRAEVAAGDTLGPRILCCSPILETRFTFPEIAEFGQLVQTPEEARDAVIAHHRAGYDFIKVYNDIDAPVYDMIIATARAVGIPVVGHVAFQKGLRGALAAKQDSIEHFRSYDFAIDTRAGGDKPKRFEGWLYATPQRVAELAEQTAEAGTWNVPTLVIERNLRTDAEMAEAAAIEDAPMPVWLRDDLEKNWLEHLFSGEQRQIIRDGFAARGAMLKALDDVGAGILAGSDCPGCRLVPGRSLLRELELMVEAGLSPWRALRTATVAAARFLGDDSGGTIAPGKRADLLLLEGDPRADISALRRQAGVAVAGRWLPSAQLERMILAET